MPRRTLYVFLVALLAIAGTVQVRRSMDVIQALQGAEGQARRPIAIRSLSNVISGASPEAQLARIQKDDRLLAVNGRLYTGESVLSRAVATAHPGDSLALRVLTVENNKERTATVSLAATVRSAGQTLGSQLLLV